MTGLSSLPAPPTWARPGSQLERDDGMPPEAALLADSTAQGVLHWAPRHDPGLARPHGRSRRMDPT